MTPESIERIESSFAVLKPHAFDLTELFYAKLFAKHPGVRPLFPEDIKPQSEKLAQTIGVVVGSIRNLGALVPVLHAMGERHVAYGTEPAPYDAVRDTLLEAMAELAGDLWTDDLQADWTAALNLVGETMLAGAARG